MSPNEPEWVDPETGRGVEDDLEEDLDEDDFAADEAGRRAGSSLSTLMTVAGVLQLVAAVLAVVSPFLAVWTLRGKDALNQASGTTGETSTTGWGSSTHGNGQGPLFGVLLTLAAVPLVIAAGVRLRAVLLARSGPEHETAWAAEPARSLGVAGSALLLGGAGSLLLVAINIVVHEDDLGVPFADASIGTGTWLALAGWLASAVALLISEHVHREVRWAEHNDELAAAIAALDEDEDADYP